MNRAGNKNEDRPFARMYLPPSSFPSSFFLSPLRDRQHLPRSPTMRSKNKPSPFFLLLLAHHCAQEDRKCKCERRERSEITSNYFVALVYLYFSIVRTYFYFSHGGKDDYFVPRRGNWRKRTISALADVPSTRRSFLSAFFSIERIVSDLQGRFSSRY